MRVTRVNLGGSAYALFQTEGVVIDRRILENGVLGRLATDFTDVPPETGPFEVADFTERSLRLSWAEGACSMAPGRIAYWGQRYAAWFSDDTLCIADASRPLLVSLSIEGLGDPYSWRAFRSHAGALWYEPGDALVGIDHTEIAALFDRKSGPIAVEVAETYPNHAPSRIAAAAIAIISRESVSVKLRDDTYARLIAIPRFEGAIVGMEIKLHEEIKKDVFRELELPDGRRIALNESPVASRVLEGRLVVEPPVDPAGGPIVVGETPSRQGDLDRLFAALADDPEDAATRDILIDLLEDSGEPYAELLHELVAGNETHRQKALGPLSNFILGLEYRGGLWCEGTLSSNAPPDPLIVDKVATDQRLGFFHTLHVGLGPFAVYAKLVGSPRAVGLRHIDVPNAQILHTMIAAKHTQLTALSHVKFATRAVSEALADPTFDRVVDLHTETNPAIVEKQLQFFTRDELGFFKRARRHLILTTRGGEDDELNEPVRAAWAKLPVAAVTCGSLKLMR